MMDKLTYEEMMLASEEFNTIVKHTLPSELTFTEFKSLKIFIYYEGKTLKEMKEDVKKHYSISPEALEVKISRNLKKLIANGLAAKEKISSDKRGLKIVVTDKGHKLFKVTNAILEDKWRSTTFGK